MSEPVACARHTETEALLDIVLSERGRVIAVPAAAGTEQTFIGTLPAAVIDPAIAGTWRHFKGGVYEFITRVDGAEGRRVACILTSALIGAAGATRRSQRRPSAAPRGGR